MYHTETIHAPPSPKGSPNEKKFLRRRLPGIPSAGNPDEPPESRHDVRERRRRRCRCLVSARASRYARDGPIPPGSPLFHRRRVECSRRAKLIRDRPARAPLTHPSPLPETQPAARRRGGRRRRDDSQAPVQGEQRRRLQPGTSRACLSSVSAIVVLCRPVEPTNLSRLQRKKNPPL